MRVLVCGGRDFTDYRRFCREMVALEAAHGRFGTIIHGAAKGADWCAHLYCGTPAKRTEMAFPANWSALRSRAGPLRNQQMLDEGRPELVIAFPGGRGTADMVRRAKASGIRVIEIATPAMEGE